MAGFKKIYSRWTTSESHVFWKYDKIQQRPIRGPGRSIWHFGWSIYCSLIRSRLSGRVAVKGPFLKKGNTEKRWAKICQITQKKKLWPQVLKSNKLNLNIFCSNCCQYVWLWPGKVQKWVSTAMCKTCWRRYHG